MTDLRVHGVALRVAPCCPNRGIGDDTRTRSLSTPTDAFADPVADSNRIFQNRFFDGLPVTERIAAPRSGCNGVHGEARPSSKRCGQVYELLHIYRASEHPRH